LARSQKTRNRSAANSPFVTRSAPPSVGAMRFSPARECERRRAGARKPSCNHAAIIAGALSVACSDDAAKLDHGYADAGYKDATARDKDAGETPKPNPAMTQARQSRRRLPPMAVLSRRNSLGRVAAPRSRSPKTIRSLWS